MSAQFAFGSIRTFLPVGDFEQLKGLIANLSVDVQSIGMWTLTLIQADEAFATRIGNEISANIAGIDKRINAMYRESMTNEQVLDECMFMLRTFVRLVAGLEKLEN